MSLDGPEVVSVKRVAFLLGSTTTGIAVGTPGFGRCRVDLTRYPDADPTRPERSARASVVDALGTGVRASIVGASAC